LRPEHTTIDRYEKSPATTAEGRDIELK
jgi:hypothetical protein